MEAILHRVARITFSDQQDAARGCNARKLTVQTHDGQVLTLILYGAEGLKVEKVRYHSLDTPD